MRETEEAKAIEEARAENPEDTDIDSSKFIFANEGL
jgi:hypothetical protein